MIIPAVPAVPVVSPRGPGQRGTCGALEPLMISLYERPRLGKPGGDRAGRVDHRPGPRPGHPGQAGPLERQPPDRRLLVHPPAAPAGATLTGLAAYDAARPALPAGPAAAAAPGPPLPAGSAAPGNG